MQINNNRKFLLEKKDLENVSLFLNSLINIWLKVFSLYGQILKIEVHENRGCGLVTFQNSINAALAVLSLNKRWLPKDKAYLSVKFVKNSENHFNS
jgi:hypothetical protein